MDSWFFYQLEFKDKYFDKHHHLNDEGKALVDKGLQPRWFNNEQYPKRNYAFQFTTKKQAEKQLRFFSKEIRKHYKVVELMGLSCFSI